MSLEAIETFPLTWPEGWRRTEAHRRTRAQFGRRQSRGTGDVTWSVRGQLTVAMAVERVLEELARMGLQRHRIVISTNVPVKRDGLPVSGREPVDPGAAVYWMNGRERRCMAIDRYDRVADNLAAIAATLDAMRAIERHGGAEILDRAFTGFVALPAPEQWWQVLGVSAQASRDDIEAAHRRLAMKHHPDRGGSDAEMARINAARDAGMEAR
jgi:hypothetical protein